MTENETPLGRWEQLNKCPDCGTDMERMAQVGEQIGLYYRCRDHGRFRYSWDHDALERVPAAEQATTPNSTTPNSTTPNSATPDCQDVTPAAPESGT